MKFTNILSRFSSTLLVRQYSDIKNPLKKAVDILKNDFKGSIEFYPAHADVVVIGGGIMGASTAYWLKERAGKGLNVVVLEKDLTFSECSTVLSVGGLRQQFSLPENILLSKYCADFLRNIKYHLGDVDVQFKPHGYLVLSNENNASELEKNVTLQREYGVKNELMSPEKLKERFPWLNVDDIKLGCIGLESEGWFDPWALLRGFTKRSQELGAQYVNAKVVGFESVLQRDVLMEGVKPGTFRKINKLIYETPDGEKRDLNFAICVLAAGAQSGHVATLANIGTGDGLLSVPLPIEPRKRYVYCFECKGANPPGLNTPMVIDHTGTWMRREGFGNSFISGRAPAQEPEPERGAASLEVTDHAYFDADVWPCLAHRVPAFENIKVKSAWAGWYEYNAYDENGIIGPHPYYNNIFIASGFSGHGLQHAPGTGRAVAELIIDHRFTSIDLTRLGFDRLVTDRPMVESNIF